MHRRSHPQRAVSILTALTILSIVVAVAVLMWDMRQRALEHSRLETVNLARMILDQTEQAFDRADLVLKGLQERLESPFGSQFSLDSFPVHLLLSARIAGMEQLSSLFIVTPDGEVINSSRDGAVPKLRVTDREYYRAFVGRDNSGLFVGRPVRSRIDNKWTMHLARRFTDGDGRIRGIAVAAVNLAHFEDLYDFTKLDFTRPVALYTADGTLAASLPHRENGLGDRAPELMGESLPAGRQGVRLLTHVSGDGARQTLAVGHVTGFPLLVSVTDDDGEALAAWRETAVRIGMAAALVGIAIVFVASMLNRELRREAMLSRALREADDRYQRTLDSVMDAILAIDETGVITMFNPAAERMFALPAAEAIGSPMTRLLPERVREAHAGHIASFIEGEVSSRAMAAQMQITGMRADGQEFPIESTISKARIDGKLQLTAVLRDVSQRRRDELRLMEANRELRALSVALQNVREQEQARIARELHDELGQQLTGLKLELSWLGGRLKEGREATPEKVDDMRRLLDTAIASVRRISTELRPPILDDLGFGEAVSWHATEFGRRSGIKIELNLHAASLVSDSATATALFRIVQESLTNVARHAGASRAEIRLVADGANLLLTVRDNGRGIAGEAADGSGIGCMSMRERALGLGGRFRIAGEAGAGTSVEVSVPIRSPVPAGDVA